MTSDVKEGPMITLSNGLSIPILGIGTSPVGGYSHEAMVCALKECGVRHIDTARLYKCEDLVAKSVKESGVARKELFYTSKAWPTQFGYDEVKKTLKKSLKDLGVEYVDLYLLHWPICPSGTKNPKELIAESWQALEECYQQGLCKSIGVSNFEEQHLNDLKETWTVVPHMNQIELHVFNYPKKLIEFCENLGIKITAYSPLAKGKALIHPDVLKIAEEHKCTPSQLLNKWITQKGIITIPKSTKPDRVKENSKIVDINLTPDNVAKLDDISNHEMQKLCMVTQQNVDEMGAGLE
ncbi:9,11-endoperoxide prostaglandin H2 reductase-like isoform X2 [Amphiura filiformis]|uniref:9,11-endoperoxide prostaglandin H2 reductase-like isoform X2 n=1 Tax=Amphiura filiformis TaxID=82378 RepID=UPI003B21F850